MANLNAYAKVKKLVIHYFTVTSYFKNTTIMKNSFTTAIYCLFFLMLVSCKKDNTPSIAELKNTDLTTDNFFETVVSKKLTSTSEKVFYIIFEYNAKNKGISIKDIVEKEPDFFVLEPQKNTTQLDVDQFKVTCSKSGKDLWTKTCDGKFSCGSLISNCLDQGGCAEICNYQAIYMPEIQTFYLTDL